MTKPRPQIECANLTTRTRNSQIQSVTWVWNFKEKKREDEFLSPSKLRVSRTCSSDTYQHWVCWTVSYGHWTVNTRGVFCYSSFILLVANHQANSCNRSYSVCGLSNFLWRAPFELSTSSAGRHETDLTLLIWVTVNATSLCFLLSLFSDWSVFFSVACKNHSLDECGPTCQCSCSILFFVRLNLSASALKRCERKIGHAAERHLIFSPTCTWHTL